MLIPYRDARIDALIKAIDSKFDFAALEAVVRDIEKIETDLYGKEKGGTPASPKGLREMLVQSIEHMFRRNVADFQVGPWRVMDISSNTAGEKEICIEFIPRLVMMKAGFRSE